MKQMLEKWFHLAENHTNVRTELLAGLTTFLAMAYILAVNPAILGDAGMPKGGVFVATAIASVIGTILMAFFSNYPFVLAPGMGLNAYFAYTVVRAMGYSWQFALMGVFIEGIIFLLLSLSSIREAIFNAIPLPLKTAVSVGVGLFITLIALQSSRIIVDDPNTLVGPLTFTKENIHSIGIGAILAMAGTLIIAALLHKKIHGAILIGILVTWGLGMIAQATGVYKPDAAQKMFSLYPNFSFEAISQNFKEAGGLFGVLFDPAKWSRQGAGMEAASGWKLLLSLHFGTVIFAFLFVDLFDTLGTVIGVASQSNLLDEKGRLKNIRGVLLADSIATSAGAILGTSTTTTYVESTMGVAYGGRTGLTGWSAAMFFLLSLLFAPVFLALPGFATAPALCIVGFYMMSNIVKLDFSNYLDAIPAFITIYIMAFAYSISAGISAGIISWTILNLICGKWKRIPVLMYILSVLFILKYILL